MPQGSFQQENGVNISGQNGGQVFDRTNTPLRFGVAQRLEVLLDVPTFFDALSGHADTGFSNVMPAIKWQISPVRGRSISTRRSALGYRLAPRRLGVQVCSLT